MDPITIYHPPGITVTLPGGGLPPPPPTSGALFQVRAKLAVGQWGDVLAQNMAVLEVGNDQGSVAPSIIPFTNKGAWDALNRRLSLSGGAHGGVAQYVEYLDATNAWRLIDTGMGSHCYDEHTCCPATGHDWHLRTAHPLYGAYERTGGAWVRHITPENMSQIIAQSCFWWSGPLVGTGAQGAFIAYSANVGALHVLDPLVDQWRVVDATAQRGEYSNVGAYSERFNCAVFGGGYSAKNESVIDKHTYRLNSDLSVTRIADAPNRFASNANMRMCDDPSTGLFHFLGFGEHWTLDPRGAGTWTDVGALPADMPDPSLPSSIALFGTDAGIVVLDNDPARPAGAKTKMRLFRSV